ncbi:NACHT domain-containing protein [Kouleothrix sp.]|uniref:NACHT domain-containing protein n=1 Tax=Kouleothrix sp. TaxID=2779161 RepID=UPI003919D25E
MTNQTINQDAQGSYIAQAVHGTATVNIIQNVAPPINDLEKRNRNLLIARVRAIWIKGFQEESLYKSIFIELGLNYKPEAVLCPWSTIIRPPHQHSIHTTSSTNIIDIFTEQCGELLILGDPGSGKTTLLLELARHLLSFADNDMTFPIPVVLNLSSWNKHQSLEKWVIDELNIRYNIPKIVCQEWIAKDQILPLLDGLDEVASDNRNACVEAINEFRMRDRGLTQIVVCSRIEDYNRLSRKLNLRCAIVAQPLTPKQIGDYIRKGGGDLLGVLEALRKDGFYRELAKNPLMLNIMCFAFSGRLFQGKDEHASLDSLREHLFDIYIHRMLERRVSNWYSPDQINIQLSYLASKMIENSQSIFQIEDIQPDWIRTKSARTTHALYLMSIYSIFYGLVAWAIIRLVANQNTIAFGSGELITGINYLLLGLGIQFAMTSGLKTGWRKTKEVIQPVDSLEWNLLETQEWLRRKKLISFALSEGSIAGLRSARLDVQFKLKPNQGIRNSAKNALTVIFGITALYSIGYGLFGGLAFIGKGILFVLLIGFTRGLRNSLLFATPLGLKYGGHAVIQHICLRLALASEKTIPWNYAKSLDYAAERILLRKVGGGYIFIHRYLLEYYAEKYRHLQAPTIDETAV